MTRTIVYTSRASVPDGTDLSAKPIWLDSLVDRASVKNSARNISGVLSYKDGRIIQLIEGKTTQLERLYADILNDKRHQDVLTLLDIKDSQRIFLEWGMVLEPNIETSILFRKFLFTHFDELVEMAEYQSDELIFFIDHIFHEIVQSNNRSYLN